MTKQEILSYFKDINDAYNDCTRLDSLSRMINELQNEKRTFTVIDATTGKEADEYDIALHEDWAKRLCYCDMEGWAIQNDGSLLLLDECGQYVFADRERFKVVWDD